ncbi:MAG: iron permease [Gammaproteobacteria bacterium]
MFLNAVVLVLQEILEAVLLIALLLVLTRGFAQMRGTALAARWLWAALVVGALGAFVYGAALPVVAEWFDYAGYEVVNSLLQAGIIACLLVFAWFPAAHPRAARSLQTCMSAVVALSIVREGSEVIVYGQGILGQPEAATPVLLGGIMAAGIGISSGYLLYVALRMLAVPYGFRAAAYLLALYNGNMAAQAILLLTQAGWMPETRTLWDISAWLPESGIAGQLLNTLVGYEANPSLAQLLAYVAAFAAFAASPLCRRGNAARETSQ